MEIARREKELEATVVRPAEANKSAIQAQAEADKYRLIAEAQGQAEAIKAQGAAEAEAIKLRGLAEAEVIRQKGFAEAEAMAKKAESWGQYNAAAVTQMFVEMLPSLARAVAEPLSKTEKIVIVSSGGGDGAGAGASRITQDVATVMAQLPPVVESLSGIKLEELVKKIPGMGKTEGAPPKKG
jgi:flotillin